MSDKTTDTGARKVSQDQENPDQDFKQLYSESSKEAFRLYEENKNLHREKAENDPQYLLSLSEKNKKIANEIAKEQYGLTVEEIKIKYAASSD